MNKTYSLDGVQAILSYPMKLAGWQLKFVIGVGLFFASYFIPIIPGILLLGYCANITHSIVVDNSEPTLPEWDDWGNLFSRGLKVFGATFVYMLPVILLLMAGYLIIFFSPFLSAFSMLASDQKEAATGIILLQMIGTFAGIFLFSIGFLLAMLISFILPPVIAHVVAKDSFASAFHIKEWWQIMRANLMGFVTALVVITGAYIVGFLFIRMLYLTIILCAFTPFMLGIFTVYMMIISSVILAEAYRKGVQNLAESVSI